MSELDGSFGTIPGEFCYSTGGGASTALFGLATPSRTSSRAPPRTVSNISMSSHSFSDDMIPFTRAEGYIIRHLLHSLPVISFSLLADALCVFGSLFERVFRGQDDQVVDSDSDGLYRATVVTITAALFSVAALSVMCVAMFRVYYQKLADVFIQEPVRKRPRATVIGRSSIKPPSSPSAAYARTLSSLSFTSVNLQTQTRVSGTFIAVFTVSLTYVSAMLLLTGGTHGLMGYLWLLILSPQSTTVLFRDNSASERVWRGIVFSICTMILPAVSAGVSILTSRVKDNGLALPYWLLLLHIMWGLLPHLHGIVNSTYRYLKQAQPTTRPRVSFEDENERSQSRLLSVRRSTVARSPVRSPTSSVVIFEPPTQPDSLEPIALPALSTSSLSNSPAPNKKQQRQAAMRLVINSQLSSSSDPDTSDSNSSNNTNNPGSPRGLTLLEQRKGWKATAGDKAFRLAYKRGAQIGSGAFGTVYIALNELTGELMAVKTIEFDTNDPNLRNKLDTLQVELNMLRTLEHPNIVQYYFSERVPSTLTGRQGVNIFMEYVPGGSILGVLQQFGALSEVVVASYTEQILLALLYLHESNVVHRDIKSANILLTTEGSCKVADFGTAMVLSAGPMTDADATTQGTPLWMAPEVLREESTLIDWHADIWSLGCTVMEMLTGRPPFEYLNKRGAAALSHVMFAEDVYDLLQLHKLPTPISASCADFLARCFSRDPKQRPSCLSLLQHPFIEAGGAHSPEPSYTKSPTQASLRTNLNTTESRPQSEMSYTHSLDRSGGAAGGVVGIENIHDDEGDEVDQRKSSAGYTTTLLLRKASLMNVLMSVADDEDGNNSFSGSSRKSRANHKLTAADVQREAKRRTDALTRDQQLRSTVLDPAAEKGQACVAVVDKLPPPHLQSPSCGSIISTSQSHSSRRRNELHSDLIDSLRSREEYDENGKGCNVSENDDDDDDDNEDGDNFVEKESVSTAVPEIHTQESIVSLFSPEAI